MAPKDQNRTAQASRRGLLAASIATILAPAATFAAGDDADAALFDLHRQFLAASAEWDAIEDAIDACAARDLFAAEAVASEKVCALQLAIAETQAKGPAGVWIKASVLRLAMDTRPDLASGLLDDILALLPPPEVKESLARAATRLV